MMNIKIIIEYIGTEYAGWQKQDGIKTIQGEIEKSIKKVTGQEIEIHGSGRTDSGVHAYGQVANFELETNIPADKIKYALNQNLPEDICILDSEKVSEIFHARFSAKSKTYIYRIQTGEVKRAFEKNRAYYIKNSLNVNKMRIEAEKLIGEHDFSSFKTEGSSAKNFVRTIYDIKIYERGDIIEIEISGNGFLYNMVRIIVGTLVEIGKEKNYDISEILAAKNREKAGPTAPPYGLYLKSLSYDEDKI